MPSIGVLASIPLAENTWKEKAKNKDIIRLGGGMACICTIALSQDIYFEAACINVLYAFAHDPTSMAV